MKELEGLSDTLWLGRQESALSIDRPAFGQHLASAFLDPTAPAPSAAESRDAFDAVAALGERLGMGRLSHDDLSRVGRRLAHQLIAPLLPRIDRAREVWAAGREAALPTTGTNWLGVTRREVHHSDIGTLLSACFGPRAAFDEVLRQLSGLWGGQVYASRDALLAVESGALATVARAMLDAGIEDNAQLEALPAAFELFEHTDPELRTGAVDTVDGFLAYFGQDDFAGLAPGQPVPADAEPFDRKQLDRQLRPFRAAATAVTRTLVALGAELRPFEVVQNRIDAITSILHEFTTVRGTSSVAIQRSQQWSLDLITVAEGFGLVLQTPTIPEAAVLDDFLCSFETATIFRSQVSGIAAALSAPDPSRGWELELARLSRIALAQKHLPRTWHRVPGFEVEPGARHSGFEVGRAAVVRLRDMGPISELGRTWLAAPAPVQRESPHDRDRRRRILATLAGHRATWLRVEIPAGSSRVTVTLRLRNLEHRPLNPAGLPIPPVVFGHTYSKYRVATALEIHHVDNRLCLSETGEYAFTGQAAERLTAAVARAGADLFAAMTRAPREADVKLGDVTRQVPG